SLTIEPATTPTPAAGVDEFALPEQVRHRWAFLHERATQEVRKLEAAEPPSQGSSAGWSTALRSPLGGAALAMLLLVSLGGLGAGLLIVSYRQANQKANLELESLRASLATQSLRLATVLSTTTSLATTSAQVVASAPTSAPATVQEPQGATASVEILTA